MNLLKKEKVEKIAEPIFWLSTITQKKKVEIIAKLKYQIGTLAQKKTDSK